MTGKMLYLGTNQQHDAVRRRVSGFRDVGLDIAAYAYRRGDADVPGIASLGQVQDGRLGDRIGAMRRALRVLRNDLPTLRNVDAIYARNLDLAIVGMLFRRHLPRRVRFIYEVLDIHPMMSASNNKAQLARTVERWILARADGLVVSSPGFLNAYFQPIQGFSGPHYLFEPKVKGLARPPFVPRQSAPDRPLTIVFAGRLRCQRSLEVLRVLAKARPEGLQIRLAGEPMSGLQEAYDALAALPNVESFGRYANPDDLEKLYGDADLNWAIDYQADFNARELLPNRLYEGGLFSVPPLVRAGTATADRAASWGIGFPLSDPIDEALLAIIDGPRDVLTAQRAVIADLQESTFAIKNDYELLKDFVYGVQSDPARS